MTDTRSLREDRAMTAISEDRWRTSVPAAFALALGLSSLLVSVIPELAAIAVGLSLIALTCGTIGMIQGTRPGVTGRGVAIAGIVLAAAGLMLSSPTLAGVQWFMNDGSSIGIGI